jgi:hypothetical protein
MDRHKLGIIIPYRNRYKQLEKFKKEIVKYLNKTDIKYEIIIIEQDDAKLFNRGMLLNIGYTYAISLKCDYIVFHDIDMLPHKVDYSYSDKPLHMATNFIYGSKEKKREIFDEHIRDKYYVETCIDDRNQVCKMWRYELGLNVLQVAEGDF